MRRSRAALLLLAVLSCQRDSEAEKEARENRESREIGTVLLLGYLALRAPVCAGQVAIRFRNAKTSSQTMSMNSDNGCTAKVGQTLSVAVGDTTAYFCIPAASYYVADTSAGCSGNSLSYLANKNYTIVSATSSFQSIVEN